MLISVSSALARFASAARRAASTVEGWSPEPRVLLLDLENFGVQGKTRPCVVERIVDDVLAQAGRVSWAACATPPSLEPLRPMLEARGFTVVSCQSGPDAADYALMSAAATALRRLGRVRFVIASGDHMFAALSEFAPIDLVLVRSANLVSRVLGARADRVLLLAAA